MYCNMGCILDCWTVDYIYSSDEQGRYSGTGNTPGKIVREAQRCGLASRMLRAREAGARYGRDTEEIARGAGTQAQSRLSAAAEVLAAAETTPAWINLLTQAISILSGTPVPHLSASLAATHARTRVPSEICGDACPLSPQICAEQCRTVQTRQTQNFITTAAHSLAGFLRFGPGRVSRVPRSVSFPARNEGTCTDLLE